MTPAPLSTHRQIQEPPSPSYMHHPPPTSKPSPLHYHPPVKPWSLFTAPPHKKRPGPPRGRSHNRAIKVENRISKLRTPEPKFLRVFSGLLGGEPLGGFGGPWCTPKPALAILSPLAFVGLLMIGAGAISLAGAAQGRYWAGPPCTFKSPAAGSPFGHSILPPYTRRNLSV